MPGCGYVGEKPVNVGKRWVTVFLRYPWLIHISTVFDGLGFRCATDLLVEEVWSHQRLLLPVMDSRDFYLMFANWVH